MIVLGTYFFYKRYRDAILKCIISFNTKFSRQINTELVKSAIIAAHLDLDAINLDLDVLNLD